MVEEAGALESAGAGACCPLTAEPCAGAELIPSSANTAVAAIAALNKPIAKNFVFIEKFPLKK